MQDREGLVPDILTSSLDGDEWLDSCSGWITSGRSIVCKYRTES